MLELEADRLESFASDDVPLLVAFPQAVELVSAHGDIAAGEETDARRQPSELRGHGVADLHAPDQSVAPGKRDDLLGRRVDLPERDAGDEALFGSGDFQLDPVTAARVDPVVGHHQL